jgi:hypothetical protein
MRFIDDAKNILMPAQMDDSTKADVWDHFHSAENAHDLSTRLQSVEGLSPDIASKLIAAKHSSEPVPSAVDRAVQAIQAVSGIDPAVLELAEKNPNVMRGIVNAAVK